MSSQPLSRELAEEAVGAVDEALGKGYRPPGVRGKDDGAIAVAGKALGFSDGKLRNRLRTAKALFGLEPDWSLYRPPEAPETIEEKVQEDSRLIRLQGENARLRA